MRAPVGEPGVEVGLSASSDETDCAAAAGAGTSADPESSFDNETSKEPDSSSSCIAYPKVVPVSVRSSSD